VQPMVSDFTLDLDTIPHVGTRLVAFLGGTIGNLLPPARGEFLASVAAMLGPDDRFLLGTDLVKDVDRLVAAYDDAQGITAAFNKNVLLVMNRELDAAFDVEPALVAPVHATNAAVFRWTVTPRRWGNWVLGNVLPGDHTYHRGTGDGWANDGDV